MLLNVMNDCSMSDGLTPTHENAVMTRDEIASARKHVLSLVAKNERHVPEKMSTKSAR